MNEEEKGSNVTEMPTDLKSMALEHLEDSYNNLMNAYKQYRKVKDAESRKFWADVVAYWADSVSFWANELSEITDGR